MPAVVPGARANYRAQMPAEGLDLGPAEALGVPYS
jgi:hypothetical protein